MDRQIKRKEERQMDINKEIKIKIQMEERKKKRQMENKI